MWSLHYNPYRTMSAKKPPPVTHNAEREMANMQQKYKAAPGWLKELNFSYFTVCNFEKPLLGLISCNKSSTFKCDQSINHVFMVIKMTFLTQSSGYLLFFVEFVDTWPNHKIKVRNKSDDNTPCTANTSGRALMELLSSQIQSWATSHQHRKNPRSKVKSQKPKLDKVK